MLVASRVRRVEIASTVAQFPALGLPLSDLADQRLLLTPVQRRALRGFAQRLSASQRRHARFSVTGFEGGPKNILVVFIPSRQPSNYHESFMVLNLAHCNIAYDPDAKFIFATTGC